MKASNNLPLMNRRLFQLSFHTQSRKRRLPSQGNNNLVSGKGKTLGITIRKKLIIETIVKTSKDKRNVSKEIKIFQLNLPSPWNTRFCIFFYSKVLPFSSCAVLFLTRLRHLLYLQPFNRSHVLWFLRSPA